MTTNTSTASATPSATTPTATAGGNAAADTTGTTYGTASAWTAGAPPSRVSGATAFAWLLRSEWGKLWSVRSTYWCAAIAVGLPIAAAIATAVVKSAKPGGYETFAEAASLAVMFSGFTTLSVMVLGLLAITSEYRAKAIHATLAAAPRRLRLLAAKTVIVAALGGLTGLLSAWASFAILAVPFDLTGNPTDLTVYTPLVGRGLHTMILAAFALAVGALLRSTAVGITTLLIEQTLLKPAVALLPGPAGKAAEYLPSAAGGRIVSITEAAHVPGAYQGLLIFALWAAALFALAGLRLRAQDA